MTAEPIWQEGAKRFMSLEHLSQARALHPEVLKLVEQGLGAELLDYGCGDGRILKSLSDRWTIDAYDPSAQMRELAQASLGDRLRRMTSTPEDLADVYDVILLGMIILCIPDREGLMRVLRDCAMRMHEASRLLVTTTHPCFRTWAFSNFSTSFCAEQPFSYLQEGTPFKVTLRDPGTSGVVFTDYHWPLGFTVNALREQGLSVVSLIEVPDDPDSPDRNPLVPPFLILECRRTP